MTFVGDRFVSLGAGHEWLDILTGRRAHVRTGAAPVDPAQLAKREQRCRERWAAFADGAELLDFGRQGVAGWFEAETLYPRAVPVRHRRWVWPQVNELVGAIADGSVDACLSIAAPTGAGFTVIAAQLARRAREFGFVTLRVDAAIPFRLRRHLLHRHLILLVLNEAARAHAAGWVAQLARVSDRRHVVLERLTAVSDSGAGGPAALTLRPVPPERLVELVDTSERPSTVSSAVAAAAHASGGWPAAFIRDLDERMPRSSVVRETAAHYVVAPAAEVARGLSRAATCARRCRPAAESQWHAAAVAAAERRGDVEAAARATAQWIERLTDAGRLTKAIRVARLAVSRSDERAASRDVTIAAARAHLMAAQCERAATFAASVLTADRIAGRAASLAARDIEMAALFWQGRWAEVRTRLAEQLEWPEAASWQSFLEWADPTDPGATPADSGFDPISRCPKWRGEPGLARAVAISLRRVEGVAQPSELAWLDALVRRERLRGLARFEQGTSEMQMLRNVTTLLEIVGAADDERSGLARVGQWLRNAAGASAAAFVTHAGHLVAGDALDEVGASPHDVTRWCEVADAALVHSAPRAMARAPLKCSGALLGFLVASGPPRCAGAILGAVQAAAAVSGPLVRSRLDVLAAGADGERLCDEILGTSPAIRAVRAAVARAASAPFAVVIEGESGTGKELVARALHRQSPRRDRTLAALNCAALTDELVDAELFGHARGAFTHAVNARVGLFEQAHHGTLFLDEVGDLSPRAQAKLLRALQEGEIRRVGENDPRPVDVRVVAATNRPLATLASDGRFREDLMFRLSVVRIVVPPLRDRPEDITQLSLAFWRVAARRVGTRAQLAPDALAVLSRYPWPGNVRQLQNAMAALSVAAPRLGRVGARLVRVVIEGLGETAEAEIVPLVDARRDAERRVIAAAMARHVGNRADAARALGLSRQGLAKALRRLGLAQVGAASL